MLTLINLPISIMKSTSFFCSIAISVFLLACTSDRSKTSRITEDFNFNWQFHYGDTKKEQIGSLSNENWENVRLPHDWSIAQEFTQEKTAGATGFLPGGIGWYRKKFNMPVTSANKLTWIQFDGVYSNSEVWINGHYLGKHPYGYTPFAYELTKYLKYDQPNLISVKVDRSAYIDCRWYPGSGIYRNVKLVTKSKTHIPQWGVFVSTPKVTKEKAVVAINSTITNQTSETQRIVIKSTVYHDGIKIKNVQDTIKIEPNSSRDKIQETNIETPYLWDIENPNMYQLVSEIMIDNIVVDSFETPFGIRSFSFDKDKGFFLNGKQTLIKGVCIHHDGGLVGSAVPRGVWKRRLQNLKEAGCNAIRTAHNPPSAEFLDLCDQMGFLVQDEAFDEWDNPKDKSHNYNQIEASPLTTGYTEHFSKWSSQDIKSMVLRDRNHPSVIMWSIGNEIEWTYPRYGEATGYWGKNKVGDVNYYWDEPPLSIDQVKDNFNKGKKGKHILATTAKRLSKSVKAIDTTRPITANLTIPTVSNFSGYADALDIVGLSYRQSVYDYVHRNYPEKVFLGTENWAKYHEWKHVLDKEYIAGIFLWTGIDYMGESREWPIRGSNSGLLDFAGFKKPAFHMFKSLWSDDPHIFITTQLVDKSPYVWQESKKTLIEKTPNWAARQKWGWHEVNEHWNYKKGEDIVVEVYTNQPEVTLFLNDTPLGTKKLKDQNDHILKWLVPYRQGKLTAKSKVTKIESSITTAQELARVAIKVDKENLKANGYDVAHIQIQLEDKNGNPIQNNDKEVVFHIDGDAKLLGIDNGGREVLEKHQSNRVKTSKGKALLIIQSNLNEAMINIKATCDTIDSKVLQVQIQDLQKE